MGGQRRNKSGEGKGPQPSWALQVRSIGKQGGGTGARIITHNIDEEQVAQTQSTGVCGGGGCCAGGRPSGMEDRSI